MCVCKRVYVLFAVNDMSTRPWLFCLSVCYCFNRLACSICYCLVPVINLVSRHSCKTHRVLQTQCLNSSNLHINKLKAKFSHTRYRALGPELIPLYRQSARRWLEAIHLAVGCHYFPPRLRLPFQPKSVTAHRPVPYYTAWWPRHIRVSSLPKANTWKLTGRDLNPRLFGSRANALPLISHTGHLHIGYSVDGNSCQSCSYTM